MQEERGGQYFEKKINFALSGGYMRDSGISRRQLENFAWYMRISGRRGRFNGFCSRKSAKPTKKQLSAQIRGIFSLADFRMQSTGRGGVRRFP